MKPKYVLATEARRPTAHRTERFACWSSCALFRPWVRRPDLLALGVFILLVNLPLLSGHVYSWLIFHPQAVLGGEWWRVFAHPFVHLTWYHLLLDGLAFLILYHSLIEPALLRRLGYVAAAAAGSLLSSCLSANTAANGLCGLSGIAHGLMAVSGVELVACSPSGSAERRVGLISFAFVIAKAGFEAISGRMFFAFLDFGLLGEPVAVSHAGGIVGALAALLLIRLVEQIEPLLRAQKGGGGKGGLKMVIASRRSWPSA